MKRSHTIFANIAICLMYLLVILFLYWTLYPYKPLEIEQPVKIVSEVHNPGDMIYADFNFEKNTNVKPDISLAIVDGVIFNIPSSTPQNSEGHNERVVGVLEVPSTVPCGIYHLHWTAKYRMNPIRTVEVKYESEKFEITSTLCAE